MGQCKYHMKVGGVNDLGPAFIHPYLLLYGLTVWAVSVTAGVVVDFHVPAIGTLAEVTAKFAGFAVQDGAGSFFLYIGQERRLCRIGFKSRFKYLADLVATHDIHPPCGQKD